MNDFRVSVEFSEASGAVSRAGCFRRFTQTPTLIGCWFLKINHQNPSTPAFAGDDNIRASVSQL
jgi:hypothetical protein